MRLGVTINKFELSVWDIQAQVKESGEEITAELVNAFVEADPCFRLGTNPKAIANLPEKMVKSRLTRAKREIKRLLEV